MKCYNHPRVDAVGRCAVCIKPLCRDCLVVVGGNGYCEQDARKMRAKEERPNPVKRSVFAINTASILAVLDGLAGVVVGFLLITLGILGPASNAPILANSVGPFLQYFANVLLFPSGQAIEIGFALIILGVADMAAGYYLWRRSKLGAIVSVAVTSIAGGLLGGFLIILALAGAFTYVYIISAVIKLATIGYGWRRLQPFRGPPKLRLPLDKPGSARGSVALKKTGS
jgi:hypothetical protein